MHEQYLTDLREYNKVPIFLRVDILVLLCFLSVFRSYMYYLFLCLLMFKSYLCFYMVQCLPESGV